MNSPGKEINIYKHYYVLKADLSGRAI